MIRINTKLIAVFVVSATVAHAYASDIQYTITDLGTFGGANATSYAAAINNRGQVVGWADDSTTSYYSNAFFWPGNGSPIQNLGTLDGQITSVSSAVAINNNGWVVGSSDNGNATDGFLWTGSGTIQNIGTLGGDTTYAIGINDAGTVVGASQVANGAYNGFTYSNGVMTNTGTLANIAINDYGQIAASYSSGIGFEQAYFVNASGQAQSVGSFGGTVTQPDGINNTGEIAGFATTVAGYKNAFLYSGGVLTDLGTLDGMDSSDAFGINDNGQVVGESYDQLSGGNHAFLYSGSGPMEDLNSLIDPNSGWILESATGINDSGQIVGIGICANGQEHAFILNPAPEPSAVALLAAAGCFSLIIGHYRRWRLKSDFYGSRNSRDARQIIQRRMASCTISKDSIRRHVTFSLRRGSSLSVRPGSIGL
jgi:probable HAF family extracellular repeat protein